MKFPRLNNFPFLLTAVFALTVFISTYSHGESEKKHRFTIGFAAMNVEMTWMKFAYYAIRKKAAELGVDLITYDAGNNVAKQAINIENLVKRGVDAIITDPVNVKGLIPTLEFASGKKIPVVAFDRSATGAPYLFFVGSDDVEAGRLACRFLADRLKGVGDIIVLEGAVGSSPAINRSKGFYDEIKKYPSMKVVFNKSGGFFHDEGYWVMEEALATVAGFNAVYSQNDDMLLGAIEAMENAGIPPKKILTIGTDAIPKALIAIREGRLDATIQYPISQVEIALERLVHYLKTGNLPEWKEHLVKPWVITSENISTGDFYSSIED
ncbi:MAG: substrate-binding domain-containing protein [Thermodesulfobacteriota bacterium]|nr:substrate-binding domain-containing protein [Thermodesulfobacteriota bacterium]